MPYGSKTGPVKWEDLIRIERNEEVGMFRLMCNIRLEDVVSSEELRTRLKLKSARECLQNSRLQLKYYSMSKHLLKLKLKESLLIKKH